MDSDKKPTEIIADPKRVDVLPSEENVESKEKANNEAKDQGQIYDLSQSWYARILCLIFFLLTLLGLFFSFAIFVICLLVAIVRVFSDDPNWAKSLKTFAIGLLSGLVFAFCFLVGIISPTWALFLATNYLSLAYMKFSKKQ